MILSLLLVGETVHYLKWIQIQNDKNFVEITYLGLSTYNNFGL